MALRATFLSILVVVCTGDGKTARAWVPESCVVLNEVMYNPAGSDLLNEFIEVFNLSETDPVDLTGWAVGEPGYTDEIVALEGVPILGPRQYAVILDPDYADSSHIYNPLPQETLRLTVANRRYLGRQGLSNSTPETLVLVTATGETVASHTYSLGNEEGHSEERISPYRGEGADNWAESEGANGTPGRRNSVTERAILQIPDTEVPAGQVVGVPLRVLGANDLFMLDLELVFDPSIASIEFVEPGGFLAQGDVPVALMDTVLTAGRVKLSICRLGAGMGGAYGDGTFAIAHVRMLEEDAEATPLEAERVRLRDSHLRLLFSESHGGILALPILRVLRISPPDGAVNAIATSPVRITFDDGPAVPVTPASFFLDAGGRRPGVIEYDSTSHTATLMPDEVLNGEELYTATVSRAVGLTEELVWSFTTSVLGDIFDLDDPRDENPYDDLLGDGWVDGDDLAVLGYFYGTTSEDTAWTVLPDLNRDRVVDGRDLAVLARMYGRKSVHWRAAARPSGSDASASVPLIHLRYDARPVAAGERVQVTGEVEAARALYALHVDLTFDREAFELGALEKGPLLGEDPHLALVYRDTHAGLSIGITRLGSIGGVDGTGCAVRLHFVAHRNATPSFSLSHVAFIADDLTVKRSGGRGAETVSEAEPASPDPVRFELAQNGPNPFNTETEIRYILPHRAHVTLSVYNAAGRRLCILVNGSRTPGEHTIRWNAEDASSGPYFYRLKADGLSRTRKMMVLK